MKAVTDQWAATVAGPHEMRVLVAVLDASNDITAVEPIDGSVTLDATSSIRGRVDLTFQGEEYAPMNAESLLAPYANELVIQRGVQHPDGTEELVQLGIFGIEDTSVSDVGGGLEVRVSGLDRARRLQNARFESPYEIPANTVISEAILSTGQGGWPSMPYEADLPSATALTLPKVVAAEGDDRWEFMRGLAESMGMVLFFNERGQLALRPYVQSEAVAEVVDGADGLLVSLDRNWSREAAFNRVIATGENTETDDVYRGVATDENSQSKTRYDGPFGRVPHFYTSPYIQTDTQALDAASAILAQELGTTASIDFGMVPNPALEPDDMVLVRRERAGANETHVLDSVSIGLAPGSAMACSTREQAVGS